MKGRHYVPICSDPDNPLTGEDFYDNTFKFPLTSKTVKKFKVNTRVFSPVIYK